LPFNHISTWLSVILQAGVGNWRFPTPACRLRKVQNHPAGVGTAGNAGFKIMKKKIFLLPARKVVFTERPVNQLFIH
jgi:hypothetical protein